MPAIIQYMITLLMFLICKKIKPPDNLMFLRQCQLSVCGGGADLHRVWRGSCQMLLPTHTAGDDHDGDHDDQDDGGMTMMVMTTTKMMVVMTITIIMTHYSLSRRCHELTTLVWTCPRVSPSPIWQVTPRMPSIQMPGLSRTQ